MRRKVRPCATILPHSSDLHSAMIVMLASLELPSMGRRPAAGMQPKVPPCHSHQTDPQPSGLCNAVAVTLESSGLFCAAPEEPHPGLPSAMGCDSEVFRALLCCTQGC